MKVPMMRKRPMHHVPCLQRRKGRKFSRRRGYSQAMASRALEKYYMGVARFGNWVCIEVGRGCVVGVFLGCLQEPARRLPKMRH